jgi:hypothetical protein
MKPFSALLPLLLLAALPAVVRADARPDFDDDAKPILRQQPELLKYVKAHFDVQDTGYSRVPGTDGHRPPPPYIFRARPHGASGPYTITLFIQPGTPGHILFVKNTGPLETGAPPPPSGAPAEMPTPAASSQASAAPAPANNVPDAPPPGFQGISSDTPSGPIKSNGQPSLAPPPDPAPAPQ